eukprot:scaffold23390_cov137-Cylindrotheca_fusiformis.AAC.5
MGLNNSRAGYSARAMATLPAISGFSPRGHHVDWEGQETIVWVGGGEAELEGRRSRKVMREGMSDVGSCFVALDA